MMTWLTNIFDNLLQVKSQHSVLLVALLVVKVQKGFLLKVRREGHGIIV